MMRGRSRGKGANDAKAAEVTKGVKDTNVTKGAKVETKTVPMIYLLGCFFI